MVCRARLRWYALDAMVCCAHPTSVRQLLAPGSPIAPLVDEADSNTLHERVNCDQRSILLQSPVRLHPPAMGWQVDELFWEHHVTGSLAACPRPWGGATTAPPLLTVLFASVPLHPSFSDLPYAHLRRWGHGFGWSRTRFNASAVDETLLGSYDLFAAMRARGIRAHSWV